MILDEKSRFRVKNRLFGAQKQLLDYRRPAWAMLSSLNVIHGLILKVGGRDRSAAVTCTKKISENQWKSMIWGEKSRFRVKKQLFGAQKLLLDYRSAIQSRNNLGILLLPPIHPEIIIKFVLSSKKSIFDLKSWFFAENQWFSLIFTHFASTCDCRQPVPAANLITWPIKILF